MSEPVYGVAPVQVLQRSYSLGADMKKAYNAAYGLPTMSFSDESVFSESAGLLAGWRTNALPMSPGASLDSSS